jgi:hypothetical protein
MGGRITAQQSGGLPAGARVPQAVQQKGHAARVVEGYMGGGSRRSRAAVCLRAPACDMPPSSLASRKARAAGSRASSAAACLRAPVTRR